MSGMHVPRHNVAQFAGNGIWDGAGVLDMPRAVGAMLGDPFSFARTPELDALAHVFAGLDNAQLVDALERTWWADRGYSLYDLALSTRVQFFEGIRRFDRDHVKAYLEANDHFWELAPAALREYLDPSSNGMVPEAALCAAVVTMDVLFAGRSRFDVWVSSLADQRASEAGPSLFNSLYSHDNIRASEDDPHDAVYTTVYESHANGWYGGNATAVFAAADSDGASGVDIAWLRERGCPGETRPRQSRDQMLSDWCVARTASWAETSWNNGDAGELRTPHYKAPGEVIGYRVYRFSSPWWHQWTADNARYFDLSRLARPLDWSLHRIDEHASPHNTSTAREEPLVLILAPGVRAHGAVYGIDGPDSSGAFHPFARGPPGLLGADEALGRGSNFFTADLSRLSTTRSVPAWGVLHRCSSTNLRDQHWNRTGGVATMVDRDRVCRAARALYPHAVSMDATTRDAILRGTLPESIVRDLSSLRVWPSDAFIDLEASTTVQSSSAARDAVCVLSVAALPEATRVCSM